MASPLLPPSPNEVHDQEMMKKTPEEEEDERMRKRVMKRVKQTTKEEKEGKVEVEMKIRELKLSFGFVKTYSDHSFHIPIRKSKSLRFLEDEESLLPPKQPIFVGAYKERYVSLQKKEYRLIVSIARAVVIGPKGTPYHDGLFFFDLEFDCFGLLSIRYYCSYYLDQIHPYIDRNGEFVSTWPLGNVKLERIPGATHICRVLHVLQLIQAEYLNEEPYYAKFDDSDDDDDDETDASLHHDLKSCLLYNELTFLTNCKMMLFLLSKPPICFEDFVAEHFRERSEAILKACKAYINGTTHVGSSSSTHIIDHPVSESFKLSLKQLYPKLVNAFEKNNNNIIESSSSSSSSSFVKKKFKIDYFLLIGLTIYFFGYLVALTYIQLNVNRLIDRILSYIQPYFERLFIRILDFFSLN